MDPGRFQLRAHGDVVRVRDADELETAGAQAGHGRDDIPGAQSDVLHAGPVVEVDELFDLRAPLAGRRLVDGHLDVLVRRGHDDGAQAGELGADVLVVDGPEAVEAESPLVAGMEGLVGVGEGGGRGGDGLGADLVHGVPVLVADAVVDGFEFDRGKDCIDRVLAVFWCSIAGQEEPMVGLTLHEGVDSLAICLDGGHLNNTVLVGNRLGG